MGLGSESPTGHQYNKKSRIVIFLCYNINGDNMNILLTGAAGNVGFETLRFLIKKNYNITVLELNNKKNKNKLKPFKKQIDIIYGSINDQKLIYNLVKDKDVIIHLAAIIPPLADRKPKLTYRVNYLGTKNIIDAIKKQLNKTYLIFASSISVYGDRVKNSCIKVTDKLKPSVGDYYAKIKIKTETLIKKSNVPYTIFRLSAIMGHPEIDPLMFHMPLDTKLEIASNIDTGRAFANATCHLKALAGQTFNLGGGPQCRTTYLDFINKMFNIYGLNPKYLKESSFADQNFHCGYYIDGDKLNNIIHFRRDTLTTYYERVAKEINPVIKILTRLFSPLIIFSLQRNSEPLQAKLKKDLALIKRFYNKKKLY